MFWGKHPHYKLSSEFQRQNVYCDRLKDMAFRYPFYKLHVNENINYLSLTAHFLCKTQKNEQWYIQVQEKTGMIQRDEHVCWISSPGTVTQNEQTIMVVDHMSSMTTVSMWWPKVDHRLTYTDISSWTIYIYGIFYLLFTIHHRRHALWQSQLFCTVNRYGKASGRSYWHEHAIWIKKYNFTELP
jgi:hypothetical protein